jgi:hypothetical protein
MDEQRSGPGEQAASLAAAPTRNLLIVHTPNGGQDLSDWLQVKQRIEASAPDIEVRIATNCSPNSTTRRWQVRRPSLVFSPCPLMEFEPRGGTIYCGRPISKLEQIERLASKDLPVPPTAILSRDLVLDPERWGRYVVVKPLRGGMGRDIRLLRTEDVAERFAELTLNGEREMVIQPYIEHSEEGYPTEYRVLTMFGHVLYAARNRWGAPRPPLEEIASAPNGIIASNDKTFGRVRVLCNDPEIIGLGERAHSAFPDIPVLGVDIIRNSDAGRLYAMEVNPMGFTWHFSSGVSKTSYPPDFVRELYAQFGALDHVAQLLIEKTRAEAT